MFKNAKNNFVGLNNRIHNRVIKLNSKQVSEVKFCSRSSKYGSPLDQFPAKPAYKLWLFSFTLTLSPSTYNYKTDNIKCEQGSVFDTIVWDFLTGIDNSNLRL